MADRPVTGFVGVGLMGWGMAKNAVEKGWPLRVIAHRKREAVDDLVKRGAREVKSLDEMAAEAEIIVLCVTGAPEVQAIVDDIVPSARPGLTIVDTSTRSPASRRASPRSSPGAASPSSTRRCRERRSIPGTGRRRPTSAGRRRSSSAFARSSRLGRAR